MKKKSVINNYIRTRQKIMDLIEPLSEEKWDEIFLGKWSLKDFVAHLIGWDIWGLKASYEILKGKLPSYYYKYYDDDWATINGRFVKRYKKGRKKNILAAVKKSHRKLVKELGKIPERSYNKDFGARWQGQKVTIASDTLFQANDEETHVKQIQRWLKTGKSQ